MPQMSPLSWTLLYALFYMTFFSFSIKLFFTLPCSRYFYNNFFTKPKNFYWPW